MSENKSNGMPALTDSGLFVKGLVVSSRAKAFNRKKSVGILVSVRHEIAYEGGMLAIEEFIDPETDKRVKLAGLQVLEFPMLKSFETVQFRIGNIKMFNNQLIASNAERVG